MDPVVSRDLPWWLLVVRGAVAIAFGILALCVPDLTLMFLVGLFAAYAIIGGAIAAYTAVHARPLDPHWRWGVVLGALAVICGVAAFAFPGITAFALVLVIGANALVMGVFDLVSSSYTRHRWPLLAVGLLSIAFGLFVIAFPAGGALALVWMVASYAIVTGAMLIANGWMHRPATPPRRRPAHAPLRTSGSH
jgi:uncharacterized membrane protein HdeD (DUF308 family)